MRKNQKTAFHNSDLGRSKPKRHFLKTFVDSNLKQPRRLHSDTGLVVDRTNPATVIRVILGLIVLHLVIIGGVMARGSISKSNSGLAIAPTITAPPVAPVQAAPAPAAPAPMQPVVSTQTVAPAVSAPAEAEVHITQPPVNTDVAAATPTQPATPTLPVAVEPTPVPAAPAVPTTTIPRMIKSGDTWGRIAAEYGITEAALKGANTQLASLTNLPAGSYMNVPVPADSAHAREAAAANPSLPDTAKYHVVKRGENLGRIAKKYKLSLPKLLKLNNMTNADARRLQVGQKLKVSE